MFNPFKPNGISHHYQLEQYISVLRGIGGIFLFFFSILNRTFQKQTVETLIRCSGMLHLVWVCTVWLCPTKSTLGLYGLMSDFTQRVFLSTVIIVHISLNRLLYMTSIIASSQWYCVGKDPMTKLSCDYRNLIACNWPRNFECYNG